MSSTKLAGSSTDEKYSAGNAYGRPQQTYDAVLTEVGPGTPCGEYMRRFWHPVALSRKVTTTPQEVRLLGEDLILFRDGKGRPGLLLPRCAHRGTTLLYGKVEEDGIRCCYHGWKFDVQGRCLEQPCEPEGGRNLHKVHQPWYPVTERYGLVFAYMGPPEKQPVLPRWEMFEDLPENETVYATDSGFSVGADDTTHVMPWNWLQDWENNVDPYHVQVLHSSFTSAQFAEEMKLMPRVEFERNPTGVHYTAVRTLPDGRSYRRRHSVVFPYIHSTPDVRLAEGFSDTMAWLVPVDDLNHRRFHVMRIPAYEDPAEVRPKAMYVIDGRPKPWIEMTDAERREWPGDWEAQLGQGRITLHSEERLATSDQGIVMLRRFLREQIQVVMDGGDPIGVSFDPDEPPAKVDSGNFFD